jgi:MFS family permease
MTTVLVRWWALMAAILAVQIGNGLSGLTISLRTDAAGFDAAMVGWIIAGFYAGQLLGPLLSSVTLRYIRMTPAFFGFTLAAGASIYGFTLSEDAPAWIVLRFMQGAGMSAMFSVVEGWLNLATGDNWRARTFAVYIMTQLVGLILGQLGVNLSGNAGDIALVAAALLMGGSGLLLLLGRMKEPAGHGMDIVWPWTLMMRAPAAVLALAFSGVNWALAMGLGPIYAARMSLNLGEITIFGSLAVLGGLLAQFPLGHWADHSSRALVLSMMGAAGAAACMCAFLIGTGDVWAIWILGFAYGAMTFPIYAIASALLGESLEQQERVAASAGMVWIFGLGATLGPLAGALAMDRGGPPALFAVAAMSLGVMVIALSLKPWPKALSGEVHTGSPQESASNSSQKS